MDTTREPQAASPENNLTWSFRAWGSRASTSSCISCSSRADTAIWRCAWAGTVGSWLYSLFPFLHPLCFWPPPAYSKIFSHLIFVQVPQALAFKQQKQEKANDIVYINEINTREGGRTEEEKTWPAFFIRAWNLEPLMLLAPQLHCTGKIFKVED